ncbi:exodeoxyribonuclease V subunit alpha [Methyloprofundus sedimenti]|uniref:RecBCD enzyme subunit RecD n=1 Tax=Methyloprofundus sedimenti TaxID=1420851 RepID=A0A1V8M1L2_9GAMM|nr:exodeoxyribonuclease V subunit alpha [Methyloprofundus sedimenti]OQK15451.1 exodeoxyribonuclease V subunit alpha [Methyloprofundus sedimenti]
MQDEISLSRLDYAFARFITQLSVLDPEKAKKFNPIIAQLSYAQSQGHSCIELNTAEQGLVLASGMADDAGKCPLVLENKQLYLQRYWSYECQLAKKIADLIATERSIETPDTIIEQYFPVSMATDWQKNAAIRAVKDPFTIITGGPGTGKTTTVVKILALLQEFSKQPLNIALAAPTGKAAMRLQQSIGQSKRTLPCTDEIKQAIPEQVITLHRLLGARPPSPYFKYNNDNPLPFDIVVIDEVSMIDLPLMSKLLNALKNDTRLILLGDKDQLASVETGTVLADLTSALPEYTQELKKSYRFSGHIKTFADAVNQQREQDAWELLSQDHAQVCLLKDDLIDYITNKQVAYLQLISEGAEFTSCFVAFNAFQVLCATRQGVNSVDDINYHVAQKLKEKKLIQSSGEWYSGRPIMIVQNDPVLRLYNGDIGLCMPDTENGGQLMVFFIMPDGSIRKYMPARLSNCETVFAMTIHKSQGSEFNEVLLVLPESMNPILTKELIYTGITRAKESLKLTTNKTVFLETIRRRVERSGGLTNRIKKMI